MRLTQSAFYSGPAPTGKGSRYAVPILRGFYPALRAKPEPLPALSLRRLRRTFTDDATRPTDRRRLSQDKLVLVLRHLLEGVSVRSTERLVGVHRDTILNAMVEAGRNCERFLDRTVRLLHVEDVQADEIWGFVGCKEKTRERRGYGEEMGDAWCFVAIERTSKMVLA